MKKKAKSGIVDLLEVMARLRAPDGCPWDREQSHLTLRRYAIEEVYELIDAIEEADDRGLADELGDVLLQVVFHSQLASERGAFDFEQVCRGQAEKLVRRHPHVFGDAEARTAKAVWAQWDRIKKQERQEGGRERPSVLDGIPKHLPGLLRAEKLTKKAKRAGLMTTSRPSKTYRSSASLGRDLFELAAYAQSKGWSAEELLRKEIAKRTKSLQGRERKRRQRSSASDA